MSEHLDGALHNGAQRSRLGRLDPGRLGVRALAVLAAVVVGVAALVAWLARPDVQPVSRPSADGSSLLSSAGPTAAATSPSPQTIVVAVSGRVRHPGLVRLPNGARVADAIQAAGGALPGTDLTLVNLARKVTDGELIVIGLPAASAMGGAGSGLAGLGGGGSGGGPGSGGSSGALVNLNTATSEQLQTLPGVGPVLAQRIIEYRDAHGGFASVADLRKVSGIGDARFNELKNLVAV